MSTLNVTTNQPTQATSHRTAHQDLTNAVFVRQWMYSDIDRITNTNTTMAWELDRKRLAHSDHRRALLMQFNNSRLGTYWLASKNGKLAGQIRVYKTLHDWTGRDDWWIDNVFVLVRKEGVCSAMFRHVIALAHADGNVENLRLHVHRNNHAAVAAYDKMKFAREDYMMQLTIQESLNL